MKITLVESLDTLKSALTLLQSAYNDAEVMDDESDRAYTLKWMVRSLKQVVRDEWLDNQVFGTAYTKSVEAFRTGVAAQPESNRPALTALAEALDTIKNIDTAEVTEAAVGTLKSHIALFVTQLEAKIQTTAEDLALSLRPITGSTPHPQNPNLPLALTPPVIPATLSSQIAESAYLGSTVIFAEGSDPASNKYRMLVIREGLSGNKVNYSGTTLAASAKLLNGRPLYIDHPEGFEQGTPKPRSIRSKAGWWEDAEYKTGISLPDGSQTNGILATANLISSENSPVSWFPGFVREALQRGRPDLVGISILASGKFQLKKSDAYGIYKEALEIIQYLSADAVAEPGAGGQAFSVAASKGVDPDVMKWNEVTKEAIKTLDYAMCMEGRAVRTDLTAEFDARIRELVLESAHTPQTPVASTVKESLPVAQTGGTDETMLAEVRATLRAMDIREARATFREALAVSKVPTSVRPEIIAEAEAIFKADRVISESETAALIEKYTRIAGLVSESVVLPGRGDRGFLSNGMIVPAGGLISEGDMLTPVEQASLALDAFFGAPIPDNKKGHFPLIHSFAEFYRGLTGDSEVRGEYDHRRGVLGDVFEKATFAEALPGAANVVGGGTITMASLLGTSMNRALFNFYKAQSKWWEPIVTMESLANLKAQTRVRLHNFGSLTERTVDGAEYTELQWGETAETYTPTEYGNLVTVGRRAIINDDLRGIQSIPRLLAQSAVITINEYISALFTVNSGNGPTLTDGIQLFNAVGHQDNRTTSALTRTSALAARRTIMKMNNDAGKRIGLSASYILCPIDLEDTAYELVRSVQVPGSANNEPNILADGETGLRRAIVVPNWTDGENWYMMADPSQLTSIELGFLYGRQEPEFFQQSAPATGMVFTNDVISHKIRHDFGADWIDYRGAVGNIPA